MANDSTFVARGVYPAPELARRVRDQLDARGIAACARDSALSGHALMAIAAGVRGFRGSHLQALEWLARIDAGERAA